MAATRQDISDWFDRGVKDGKTHMLIICDTYDHDDYPVFVSYGSNPRDEANRIASQSMQVVMECYNLTLDKESQLNERRAHHYEQVNPK